MEVNENIVIGTQLDTNPNYEKIKIIKNTKGYNWEIQILKEKKENWDDVLANLKALNEKVKAEYGNTEQ